MREFLEQAANSSLKKRKRAELSEDEGEPLQSKAKGIQHTSHSKPGVTPGRRVYSTAQPSSSSGDSESEESVDHDSN